MTWTGFSLTMASGIISATSSALIIYVILRSMQKLSTTYHRIMTFMSLCDLIQSVCMALGTIPMPKDSIYKFDGPMLGTLSTCTAQAYIVFWGLTTGMFLNLFLSWYYVCDITFKIKPETIQRRLEPIFYILAASYGIFVPTFFLHQDLLNEYPFAPFCLLAPYPFDCNEIEGTIYEGLLECDSGPSGPIGKLFRIFSVIIGLKFVGIAVAMLIIIYTALQNERQARKEEKETSAEDNELDASDAEQFEVLMSLPQTANTSVMDNGKPINRFRYNRVIVIQALLYILAFFMTYVFVHLSQLNGNYADDTVLHKLSILFLGLQGFWNMIIFLHQKTYLVLKYDENANFWKALKTVLVAPNDVPAVYICNIVDLRTSIQHRRENIVVVDPPIVVVDPPVGSEYDDISFDTPSAGPQSFFGLVSSNGRSNKDSFDEDEGDHDHHFYDLSTTMRKYGI